LGEVNAGRAEAAAQRAPRRLQKAAPTALSAPRIAATWASVESNARAPATTAAGRADAESAAT